MIAKPTDGPHVCFAVRAGKLDLGIIQRAFGHDASLSKNKSDSTFGRRLERHI
jgi:hypothetical protein